MLRDLRQVCERPGSAEPDDFRSAAKALLKRQTLLGRYETLLGRKLPPVSDYREVLRRLRRYSLIEIGDETEDGLPVLRIRSCLVEAVKDLRLIFRRDADSRIGYA